MDGQCRAARSALASAGARRSAVELSILVARYEEGSTITWPPKQPERAEIAEAEVGSFDHVIERARRMRGDTALEDAGYYGRLMLSPELGAGLSHIGTLVRAIGDSGRSFTHAQREFVDQILSADLQTNIVQDVHLNDAVATGVSIRSIRAIREGREETLTDKEVQLADFIRRVVSGRVDGASWMAMEAALGERGTVEYTVFILFLQLTMRLMQAVGMPSLSDGEVDALIAQFESGELQPHDFRARIA